MWSYAFEMIAVHVQPLPVMIQIPKNKFFGLKELQNVPFDLINSYVKILLPFHIIWDFLPALECFFLES